jgi:hypothetical protein
MATAAPAAPNLYLAVPNPVRPGNQEPQIARRLANTVNTLADMINSAVSQQAF